LTGWLYTSAHFAAAKMVRTENRRRDREEKFMREPTHETAPEADWQKLRPALDEIMHELKETDREAVLLRYFENRQFAEVGEKLGVNETAARMRVERAVEKLHDILAKRGITTVAALSAVISANAVQIAPAGLAATLTTASLAAAGSGTALTLLKIMTATKLKLGLSALVVAGAATAVVVQHQTQTRLRTENESLRQQLAQLQNDNGNLSNRLAAAGEARSLTEEQMTELLKLRGEVGVLRSETERLERLNEAGVASNKHMSNQLAAISSDAITNTLALTNVYYAQSLRDVGGGTLEDAFQTALYSYVNHEFDAHSRIMGITWRNQHSKAHSQEAFGYIADLYQGLSEIDLYGREDRLDGTVDLSARLKYAEGAGTNSIRRVRTLDLHFRPSTEGWQLISDSIQ